MSKHDTVINYLAGLDNSKTTYQSLIEMVEMSKKNKWGDELFEKVLNEVIKKKKIQTYQLVAAMIKMIGEQ